MLELHLKKIAEILNEIDNCTKEYPMWKVVEKDGGHMGGYDVIEENGLATGCSGTIIDILLGKMIEYFVRIEDEVTLNKMPHEYYLEVNIDGSCVPLQTKGSLLTVLINMWDLYRQQFPDLNARRNRFETV